MAMAAASAPPLLLKLFMGVAALSMNMAMRHVVQDVSPMQQRVFESAAFKCVAVFAMFFVSTRDPMIALALTALTIVAMRHLLHEHSPLCIIPGCVGGIPPPHTHNNGGGQPRDALLMGPAAGGPITRELYDAAVAIVQRGSATHAAAGR